jgi:DNA repair protein RadC
MPELKSSDTEIVSAEFAATCLRGLISEDIEEFWALALGPKKNLLQSKMIFRGTVDACLVHPRDIFRFACRENASSILVAHNHPSGDPLPSVEDLRFTRQLIRASEILEIPLIDHVIITHQGFSSMRRDGWCQFDSKDSTLHSRHDIV